MLTCAGDGDDDDIRVCRGQTTGVPRTINEHRRLKHQKLFYTARRTGLRQYVGDSWSVQNVWSHYYQEWAQCKLNDLCIQIGRHVGGQNHMKTDKCNVVFSVYYWEGKVEVYFLYIQVD